MVNANSLKNLRPAWQAGQSGNATGRPRRKHITDELVIEADVVLTAKDCKNLKLPVSLVGLTKGRAVARIAFEKALQGDVHAMDKITDRLEGKAQQSVELTGADGVPVQLQRKYELLSDEQIAQMVSIAEQLQLAEAPAEIASSVVDAVATEVEEAEEP